MLKFDDSEFLRCTWPCCKGIIADAKVDAYFVAAPFGGLGNLRSNSISSSKVTTSKVTGRSLSLGFLRSHTVPTTAALPLVAESGRDLRPSDRTTPSLKPLL